MSARQRIVRFGCRWIAAYLGNGENAQRALRSLDERLFKTRSPLLVTGLHALGPHSTGELLLEVIGNDDQLRDDVFALLEKYARLSVAEVHALGADTFPPAIFAVEP